MSEIIVDFENVYENKAYDAGYDLNNASNGILLPTHFGHQKKVNRPRHRGYHSVTYVNKVFDVIEPIYHHYENQNTCQKPWQERFINALLDAEKLVRTKVRTRTWWLYSWSKLLWDEDYCDEGYTEAKLKSKSIKNRMTSRASGIQWVKDRKGKIKRRYIEQKIGNSIKKVTNADWYTKNTYPKHPDPRK
jgi:hypothetical protein